VRVLFATAELSPIARVGGLAEAAAGLVRALRLSDVDVDVVLPDYGGVLLEHEHTVDLDVPAWVGSARARRGVAPGFGPVTLVDAPGIARPHPYLDGATGDGWPDNDARFFHFSAAVAALVERERPDVLHLNDWHTAAVLGLLHEPPPTAFTIHTLGYQGWTNAGWLNVFVREATAYERFGGTNPLVGALRLAQRIIAVSPTYAREILTPEAGMGLDDVLRARVDVLVGIRNGIDDAVWNPTDDRALASTFSVTDLAGKGACRAALATEAGWPVDAEPIIGMVTRLTDQKGVDLALELVPLFDTVPARLVVLGAGDRALADRLHAAASERPGRVAFREGYDDAFGHRIFGGADLYLMPSRFEPCGLAQMQAMAYGTIPVATDVGGLHDTVIDDDRARGTGTGFTSRTVDTAGLVDALHRAVRAVRHNARRKALQRRGMQADWSWELPAREHLRLYDDLLA
jgi:starch synthase